MIHTRVSAVFQIRDGFTGRVVEGGSLVCALDGIPLRPISKPGGYLVLVNLPAGSHRLTIRSVGFQEERVDFTVEEDVLREGYISLKPDRQYRFHQSATRLRLAVPEGWTEQGVWITTPGTVECKVAQAKAEAGSKTFRVYCKGQTAQLPIPGAFLIEDGDNSEIIMLQSLSEETGTLAEPLRREHGRSRRLLPVQLYRPDAQGEIRAAFPSGGSVAVYSGSGSPQCLELTENDNEWDLRG